MADGGREIPLTRLAVQSAHELIKEHIHRTPVLTSSTLSSLASTPQSLEALIGTPFEGHRPAHPRINFFFKCENYQRIGAFKIRGAFHALARLSKAELARGVVTHSSGISAVYARNRSLRGKALLTDADIKVTMRKHLLLQRVPTGFLLTSSCLLFRPHQRSLQHKAMVRK